MKPELDIGGRYEILQYVSGSHGGKKVFLGETGKCRFCNNNSSSFLKKAHAFPESLGNKWVFSNDECDECNLLFSKYEGALIDCVKPLLTLGGVKGKRKVPQSGRSAGKNFITHEVQDGKRRIHMSATVDNFENIMSVNPHTGIYYLRVPIPSIPFVPKHAYKALAKMAFALLPDDEILKYLNLRNWLQNRENNIDCSNLEVFISFSTIGQTLPIVAGSLLRRVNNTDPIPYIIFLFMAGSICLQINLMSDNMEKHISAVTLGNVKLNWTTIIQGHDSKDEIKYTYSEPQLLNWASNKLKPQPIESMEFEFNPITCQGYFHPIFRSI